MYPSDPISRVAVWTPILDSLMHFDAILMHSPPRLRDPFGCQALVIVFVDPLANLFKTRMLKRFCGFIQSIRGIHNYAYTVRPADCEDTIPETLVFLRMIT